MRSSTSTYCRAACCMHRGYKVEPAAIERTALLTIEGERDDISGLGQTRAAHKLAHRLPEQEARALRAAERRPLRPVQRPALPQRGRAAHQALHPDASVTRQRDRP